MGPQHRFRGWVIFLMAFVAFAFMAALYASRPSEASAFAVNTPDNRLEVFRIRDNGLVYTASIPANPDAKVS